MSARVARGPGAGATFPYMTSSSVPTPSTSDAAAERGVGLAIGIELDGDGAHPSAWRVSRHAPDELLTGRVGVERVERADRAGFTFATFADSPLAPASHPNIGGRIDAVQRAAYSALPTGGIGLVPEAHSTYTEPFHLSSQLASLDYASRGRGGWVVTVDADPRIAAEYGREPVDQDAATARATDAVEVVRRLWDSWQDDAVIRDAATGRYLDRDRLNYIDFVGADYSIKGPAIAPRPPQGALPIFGDAALAGAVELDVALLSSAEGLQRQVRAVREAEVPLAILELEVILDHAGQSAADRLAELDAHTHWAPSRSRFVGSSEELVALIAGLAEHVDGLRLHPAVLDIDLDELAWAVLPPLRALGLFASPRPGDTLRESLGLPRAINRYSTAKENA